MLVRPTVDVVHALAALSMVTSLLLLTTTLLSYGAPYDRALSERQRSVPPQANGRLEERGLTHPTRSLRTRHVLGRVRRSVTGVGP